MYIYIPLRIFISMVFIKMLQSVVVSMTFMLTQRRTLIICSPKLIAIFPLGKNVKAQSYCKDAKFYHFIG